MNTTIVSINGQLIENVPFVAFSYGAEMWAFIERKWNLPMYDGYGTWDIVANELYDFSHA